MKVKSILICFIIACGLSSQAQDYKVIGMESLPMDMTAREHIKTDVNDKQCAVLRIATQNITPEQRENFYFQGDYGSYVVERNIIAGEICIWVSPGLKTLKIFHDTLGRWELHTANYGITIEPLHVYKIVIQGITSIPDVKSETTQQYLEFQISPPDAELEVDGEIWPLSGEGTARRRVNKGTYYYRITSPDYRDEEGTVLVDISKTVSVTLIPISKETKAKQLSIEQSVPQKTVSNVFFVMANAAYSIAPQISSGLTIGSTKKLGWYVSLGTNFNLSNIADYKCDGNGQINGDIGNYQFSGTKKTSLFTATTGMVIRIGDPVYAFAGGGYGQRSLLWELYDSDNKYGWAKNTDYSYQGLAFDAGVMMHFKGFGFSIGVQTIGFNYMEAKIGIGYTLKK